MELEGIAGRHVERPIALWTRQFPEMEEADAQALDGTTIGGCEATVPERRRCNMGTERMVPRSSLAAVGFATGNGLCLCVSSWSANTVLFLRY